MNTAVVPGKSASFPIPEFGRSADGLTVARIGDAAYAIIPKADGRYFPGSGWRLSKPLSEWNRSDFYGHGGDVKDEAAFRALVQEQTEHQGEKAALGRQEFRAHASTPWGPSQGALRYGEGVVFHSTSGHGGFHLTPDRNAQVHPLLRAAGGWYEEDAAWAAVATAWPDLFTGIERRQAGETLRHSWPDAWEAIHGRALRPGESRTRDSEAFARDHVGDWVVISAIFSDQHRGFTEVIATRGGRRDPQSEERRFLVPSGDYKVRAFGFVIDEARHAVYDGPSSFIGWRGRAGAEPQMTGADRGGRAPARGRDGRGIPWRVSGWERVSCRPSRSDPDDSTHLPNRLPRARRQLDRRGSCPSAPRGSLAPAGQLPLPRALGRSGAG